MPVATRHLGKPLKRKEDPRLIQGLAHYVDDIVLPGMLHVAILRSPYAHAKIRSVDVSKAQGAPGVVQVLTGADVRGSIGAVPMRGMTLGVADLMEARQIVVLASGHAKAAIVAAAIEGKRTPEVPASWLQAADALWLLDRDAASGLSG